MKKRFLSLLLVMVMAILPTQVFASGVSANASTDNESTYSSEQQYSTIEEAYAAFEATIVLDEWYEWFNSLTPEAQERINYRPDNFVETQKTVYGIDVRMPKSTPTNPISISDVSVAQSRNTESKVGMSRAANLPTGGYELAWNPGAWNTTTVKPYSNCYTYALNYYWPGRVESLSPSLLAGYTFDVGSMTTKYISDKILLDIPYLANNYGVSNSIRWRSIGENSTPSTYYYKVAMVYDFGRDYHFYRQDSDGLWSHKRGRTEVIDYDADSYLITNPRTANRNYPADGVNYSTWCGFFEFAR